MNIREKNVEIFNDTIAIINNSEKLTKSLEEIIKNQKIIFANEKLEQNKNPNPQDAKIVLSNKRTIEAASYYRGKKICIHNFASATNPGGGVTKGSQAQEESICRITNLYPCLSTTENIDKFFTPHKNAHNPIYNDDIIYSPGVDVIKTDDIEPQLMDEKDWFKVDVLTCAAPNLRAIPSNIMNPESGAKPVKLTDEEFVNILTPRVKKIFEVASYYGCEVLILGAFGCGAFMNPPHLVASVFKNVMKDYIKNFETIEFAVYCRAYETKNYDAFKQVFEN